MAGEGLLDLTLLQNKTKNNGGAGGGGGVGMPIIIA